MNYWWVTHGTACKIELCEGYISAPKTGRFYWENAGKVCEGDLILSYARNCILAKVKAIGKPVTMTRPPVVKPEEYKDRWEVPVEWTIFSHPFEVLGFWKEHKALFEKLEHSPLTKDGTGCQGYLYQINAEIYNAILKRITP